MGQCKTVLISKRHFDFLLSYIRSAKKGTGLHTALVYLHILQAMGVKSYILYGNPQKERARGTKKKSVGISRICDVNTYPTDPTDFF